MRHLPHPDPLVLQPSPIVLFPARDESVAGTRLRASAAHIRVRPGVYAAAAEWRVLRPWERYLARVHAHALRHPDAVFCLESAAALLALPIFGEPRDIHVFDVTRDRGRRYGDVVVHASENGRAVAVGSLLATSVPDTALDLMRVLPPAFALAVGDAAARHPVDPCSSDDLRAIAGTQTNRRGRARLEWAFQRIDPRAESVAESVSRAVIEWCGYPAPVLQQRFHYEGVEDRSDFYFPEERVIGESDGYGKYLSDTDVADPRKLREEKAREDRLRRHERGFARWDYADAMRVRPLDEKLGLAGLRPVRPSQPGMLATLRQHPRSL
jgi:hypothetical protein